MSSYAERMIDAVGDLDFTDAPVDQFAMGAFTLLVLALRKLPPDARAELLLAIEDGSALRRALAQLPDNEIQRWH